MSRFLRGTFLTRIILYDTIFLKKLFSFLHLLKMHNICHQTKNQAFEPLFLWESISNKQLSKEQLCAVIGLKIKSSCKASRHFGKRNYFWHSIFTNEMMLEKGSVFALYSVDKSQYYIIGMNNESNYRKASRCNRLYRCKLNLVKSCKNGETKLLLQDLKKWSTMLKSYTILCSKFIHKFCAEKSREQDTL